MRIKYKLYIVSLSSLLLGCTPYIGTCSYPVVKLDQATSIEKKGFLGGRCKLAFSQVPIVYSVTNTSYKLKLIIGKTQYPELFFIAMDNYGAILDIKSKNTFLHPVTEYFKQEQLTIEKETGYFVSHVYNIQKELSTKKQNNNSLTREGNITIDIISEGESLGEHLIEYDINCFKHLAVDAI